MGSVCQKVKINRTSGLASLSSEQFPTLKFGSEFNIEFRIPMVLTYPRVNWTVCRLITGTPCRVTVLIKKKNN